MANWVANIVAKKDIEEEIENFARWKRMVIFNQEQNWRDEEQYT